MSIITAEKPARLITPEIPGVFTPHFARKDETPAYHYRGFRGNIAEVLEVIKGINDETITLFEVQLPALSVQLNRLEGYPICFDLMGEKYYYCITMWRDRIIMHVCSYDAVTDDDEILSTMWPETTQQALMALGTILEDCRFPNVRPKPEEALSVLRELLASR